MTTKTTKPFEGTKYLDNENYWMGEKIGAEAVLEKKKELYASMTNPAWMSNDHKTFWIGTMPIWTFIIGYLIGRYA